MPQRVRVTPSGRERMYLTRHMWADESKGEIYVEDSVVNAARALGYVEDISAAPRVPARRGPGRPRKVAAPPAAPAAEVPAPASEPPAAQSDEPNLYDLTNAELRALAEQRGIALPTHYVTNDNLIGMLKGN